MDQCPNDPSNGYGSHNVTHPLSCDVAGCDCLAALRKDAERYRWLRDHACTTQANTRGPIFRIDVQIRDIWFLNDAIDAAMSEEPAVGAA
jgi:hypothetical protein